MTEPLDDMIREVVHELAREGEQVHPADRDRRRFAIDTTDRGYQRRNRRRAGIAGVVVLFVAVAVGIPYGVSRLRADGTRVDPGSPNVTIGPDGVPTHDIDDTSRPIELVDGWYVLGNSMILDRPKNTYRRLGARDMSPSPNGEWYLSTPGSGEQGLFRVTNISTGASRQYSVPAADFAPQWSPDGTRILFTTGIDSPPSLVATFIDVTTGTISTASVDLAGLACVSCTLTWLPSGQEIALTLATQENDSAPIVFTGVQTFTLAGVPARTLPIEGRIGAASSWSPNGRVVVAVVDSLNHTESRVIDINTGTVVRTVPFALQASWVDNDKVLLCRYAEDGAPPRITVTLESVDGTVIERWILPQALFTLGMPYPTPPLVAKLGA